MVKILLWIMALTALLSGCGGGGSSNASATDPLPPLEITLLQPAPVLTGANIALSLNIDNAEQIQWSQIEGPRLILLDEGRPLLGIELADKEADYSFQADYLVNNVPQRSTISFSSQRPQHDQLVIRRDRTVAAGTQLSLRVDRISDTPPDNIVWQQLSGPAAKMVTENEQLFLTLPRVIQPTRLSFSASSEIDGEILMDQVWIDLLPQAPPSNNAYFEQPVAAVTPYQQSHYASALSSCLYNNQLKQSCLLSRLPLLANDAEAAGKQYPTTEMIMDRVLVSHPWMGEVFRDFLEAQTHSDFHTLFSAVTGIVISYDIRPSFYWAATGAIYLDAENLWLNAQQRDLINEQPDYRTDYGATLQFDMLWRYVKDNDYAYETVPRSVRWQRNLADIQFHLSALLYHELAHANDFLPPISHSQLSPDDPVLTAVYKIDWLSKQLTQQTPLQATLMSELANVAFRGVTATESQNALQPEDIALLFPADGAVDFYSYSSEREDLAMLFEEWMMQYRLGVLRDVAITNNPRRENSNGSYTGSDYLVNWGQRGRVGELWVKQRAEWVLENILTELDVSAAGDQLIVPLPMFSGQSWLDNLLLSPQPMNRSNKSHRHQESFERLKPHGKPLPRK